ncbi:hypothetical protein [Burkholderia vietnamiensis]|uniref:hypothetical protein n=1 Tax=Burkholderia vietnamiensis TaxID=60552 RepID=UPI001CAEC434|nr:hypothetical protein [Burkholderia vietnamiensis]CAG9229265.1 hypothetical protein BVI1335_70180 [Burkholderia vietnamiensis]HDR9086293.1 hypothetical protein [Burkholderia vietnamiensis]
MQGNEVIRADVQALLHRTDEIRIKRDEDKLYTILGEIQNLSDAEKAPLFAQSRKGGGVFLFESRHFPGHIVEYIPGVMVNDSISCMFEPHPVLGSPSTLLKLREELVAEIERIHHAIPGALHKADPARHRPVMLIEMSTLQLADTLRETARVKL